MKTVTIRMGGKTEFQKADELIRQAQEAERAQEPTSAKFAAEKRAGDLPEKQAITPLKKAA